MSLFSSCRVLFSLIFLLTNLIACKAYADDFRAPTPDELSMTAEPAAPNASAVYLFREEITDDNLHMHIVYVRLKVLTDEGKKFADVEIPYEGRAFSITNVEGRTIQSDGTIVAFTGKPYNKMVAKTTTQQYQRKVFSMPAVRVGSILEYRYIERYEDSLLLPPSWFIQSDLYLRKAHYRYLPYVGLDIITTGRNQGAASMIWFPILPAGAAVKHTQPPKTDLTAVKDYYDLDVEKIPPAPDEEYLPPIHSLTFRVYFLYSAYNNPDEFWKKEGKYWSKQADRFMNARDALNAMVSRLTAPSDSPDLKLQKLYNGVMAFENSDFTRDRTAIEEKTDGFRTVKTAQDIIDRKRGNSDELTLLFVGLARAAGMKAYVMSVTDRDREIFNANLMSMNQLNDDIAIVNVDGKEKFFDPGERYCPYGQLQWKHTLGSGIRQTDDGTAITSAPDNPYNASKTIRIAQLTMSEDGRVSGKIRVGYTGVPALDWRQRALEADQAEVERDMEHELQNQLPGGVTVKLDKLVYLDDPSKQLAATFSVEGPLATLTSKRLFVPVEIFEANERPMFTQVKREMPVYFHYAYQADDEITITLPASVSIESTPPQEQFMMEKLALLREGTIVKGNTLTLQRDFQLGVVIFKPDEYTDLHTFYAKVIHKDQEQAILKASDHASGN